MSGKLWVALLGLVSVSAVALADGPAAHVALPPLVLPTGAEGPVLPQGHAVSRPLQTVVLEPSPAPAEASSLRPSSDLLEQWEVLRPLPNSWTSLEYLIWWPSRQPLPPLVTAARGTSPPVLGGTNTVLLIGDSSLDNLDLSGARFTYGFAVNQSQTAALSVAYFFLGSRTVTATAASTGRPRPIGRPIIDAETGDDDVIPVAIPGSMGGGVDVSATSRLTGWEVNGTANLVTGPNGRIHALAGYRYFMANEGLRIDQLALFPSSPMGRPSLMVGVTDQFDAHNRFHGAQLGLAADWTQGPVYIEAVGKIGFGRAINVVRVSGQTVAVAGTSPTQVSQWFEGGVLAQPTNAGRHEWSGFAVLPEAGVKIGYRFRDRSRLYIGYNFIYLSEAVRPGDQIDLTVDESQVPLLGRSPSAFADRPGPNLARSDFWVQGLVFGLEYRY